MWLVCACIWKESLALITIVCFLLRCFDLIRVCEFGMVLFLIVCLVFFHFVRQQHSKKVLIAVSISFLNDIFLNIIFLKSNEFFVISLACFRGKSSALLCWDKMCGVWYFFDSFCNAFEMRGINFLQKLLFESVIWLFLVWW